jgi:DNA-binding NarL/FixJ family response regulator
VTIKVFLLDDHEVVREGIRHLLEMDDDIEVVGSATTAVEAIERIPSVVPDVAILDVVLEEGSGVEVCRDLRSLVPGLACLMLTSYADDEALYASVVAGASGYVLKSIQARSLIENVKRVASGHSLIDAQSVARVIARISQQTAEAEGPATLSAQEKRILDLIAQGKTNRQIAEEIFLAEKTVRNYVSNLLTKLNMSSRTEAAVYATKRASGQP